MRLILFITFFLVGLLGNQAFGAPAGIFKGRFMKLLPADGIEMRDDKKVLSVATDPTSVAVDADQGSLLMNATALYWKQDNGATTNWIPFLLGPAGSGTDECFARWDGTGVPILQDSIVCVTDAGVLTGPTQLNVDNLRLDGNTLSSTDVNGNLILDANGTGEIHVSDTIDVPAAQSISLFPGVGANNISIGVLGSNTIIEGDLTVNGTTTTVNSTTLDVDAAKINVNVDGTQAAANLNDAGVEVTMTDAQNAGLAYDSSLASSFKIGETNDYREVVTVSDNQDLSVKLIDHRSGTAALPTAIWNGDTDTGFFSDAGDAVQFSSAATEVLELDGTSIDATVPLTATQLNADNLRLDGNTLSSEDVNGNIILNPNGTGNVQLPDLAASTPLQLDASNNIIAADIDISTGVTGVLPIANGGTNSSTALNNDRIMVSSGGAIVEAGALTNGQILIGSTGAAPVGAAISGTANQVSVANGAGSITLSTPQDIHTGASPTFADLTISNLAANAPVRTNGSSQLTTGSIALGSEVSGVLPIANGGTNSSTALNNDRVMLSSGGAVVESSALTNGQLLIGSTGAAPVLAGLTGTANQISVTPGAGSITLATPQDIHSGASPTFVGATLSGLTQNSVLFAGAGGAISQDNANFSWVDGSDTFSVVGQSNFDNLRADGNTISSTNGAGDIVIDPDTTGEVDLNLSGQVFKLDTVGGNAMTVQHQSAATDSQMHLYSADGDGTDSVFFRSYGLGTPDSQVNTEFMSMGYDSAQTEFAFLSQTAGSGVLRGMRFQVGGNADQIYLNPNGRVGIRTDNPQVDLDTPGAISSNGLGVKAENLLINGGFESGTVGFTVNTGSLAVNDNKWGDALDITNAAGSIDVEACITDLDWAGEDVEVTCDMDASEAGVQLCIDDDTATNRTCEDHPGTGWNRISTRRAAESSGTFCLRVLGSGLSSNPTIDNCKLGEPEVEKASASTNMRDCTATASWTTNTTVNCKYRDEGQVRHYELNAVLAGAPNAAILQFDLPTGDVVDTASTLFTVGGSNPSAQWKANAIDSGNNTYPLEVTYVDTNTIGVRAGTASGTYTFGTDVSQVIPFTFAINDRVEVKYSVPLTSLSSPSDFISRRTNWYIDAEIGGSNPSLGTSAVTSYTEITNASLDLVQLRGAPVGIACSGTEEGDLGDLTCTGNESLGIVFDYAGDVEACATFSHFMSGNGPGSLDATFQVVKTENDSQVILEEGGRKLESAIDASTATAIAGSNPLTLCGTFRANGKTTLRVMYEQSVAATINTNLTVMDRLANNGDRNMHWSVKPITKVFNASLKDIPEGDGLGQMGFFTFEGFGSGGGATVNEPGTQNVVSSVSEVSGIYTYTLSQTFSRLWGCHVTGFETGAGTNVCKLANTGATSVSSLLVRCINSTSGAGVTEQHHVSCLYEK